MELRRLNQCMKQKQDQYFRISKKRYLRVLFWEITCVGKMDEYLVWEQFKQRDKSQINVSVYLQPHNQVTSQHISYLLKPFF